MTDWKLKAKDLSERLDLIVNTPRTELRQADFAVIDLASSIVLNHVSDQAVKDEWDQNTQPYWIGIA